MSANGRVATLVRQTLRETRAVDEFNREEMRREMNEPTTLDHWFSARGCEQLRLAVAQRLVGPTTDSPDGLIDACRHLRTEAQLANLTPADLMKAVRDASLQTSYGRDRPFDDRYCRLLDDCLTVFLEDANEAPKLDPPRERDAT